MIGSFEARHKDLLGRIGRLRTRSGVLETPHLFPVINPQNQPVPLNFMRDGMGINGVITNAYLIKKSLVEGQAIPDVHSYLNYDGIIATDSGAYQILVYGSVDISPLEAIRIQESLNPDVAVILDVPTGHGDDHMKAEESVDVTLERAETALKIASKPGILWMGPVQGGLHLDLLSHSARRMASKPFPIYALGSPTPLMEKYMFESLVEMMMTAKANLPMGKPLHLFGAGHPLMLSLAVACGFDTFDSASYAIYARNGRYMTTQGTYRLKELRHFPCTCRVCSEYTVKEVSSLTMEQATPLIAEHNLWVCCAELKRIKQAIIDGRLWELIALRARSHPSLYRAFKKFSEYGEFVERYDPVVKRRGIFYFSSIDSRRPEILHYLKVLGERFVKPPQARILILSPWEGHPSYSGRSPQRKLLSHFKNDPRIHSCFYTVPYGVVPTELDEVFPLFQMESAKPMDPISIEQCIPHVEAYVRSKGYEGVLLLRDNSPGWKRLVKVLDATCSSLNIKFDTLDCREGELLEKLSCKINSMID